MHVHIIPGVFGRKTSHADAGRRDERGVFSERGDVDELSVLPEQLLEPEGQLVVEGGLHELHQHRRVRVHVVLVDLLVDALDLCVESRGLDLDLVDLSAGRLDLRDDRVVLLAPKSGRRGGRCRSDTTSSGNAILMLQVAADLHT